MIQNCPQKPSVSSYQYLQATTRVGVTDWLCRPPRYCTHLFSLSYSRERCQTRKTFGYRLACLHQSPHVLYVKPIHPGGKVAHTSFMLQHGDWLWRIQKHMRIRSLKLGQLGHTNGYFWQARTALAQKSIRGKPRSGRVHLHILAKSHIHSIMVFGYIASDVFQTNITNLHVDRAVEQHTQNRTKADTTAVPLRPLAIAAS